jgi:cytochrome oxidase Cu insertion factor (SCO1/SenC/PrrC family)
MKHLHLTLSLLVCALAFFPAQAQKKNPQHGKASPVKEARPQMKETYYSCPMHPDVKAKTAGRCPKCGMDLRVVHHDKEEAQAGVTLNPATNVSLGETAVTAVTGPEQLPKMNIPDTELLDQNGRKIHFYTDLVKGRTVAINFIFTTCTTICPPLGATFARVQKELGDKMGRDVSFISISVDPTTDTPERLKAWGAKFHAGEGWTFVTGNKPEIDELLRALAASSARREDHSPTVLIGNDARGNWTRAYGLAKASQLVQIINDVMAGKTATTTAEASN